MISKTKRCVGLALVAFASATATATQIDVPAPPNSGGFGADVTVLPNGNFVVSDQDYSTPGKSMIGAVHLYRPDGTLVSTLTGDIDGDLVGSDKPIVLANGNFVVASPGWHHLTGAVTLVNAATGLSGIVSASNSLVGQQYMDRVGALVVPLPNGNFVTTTSFWSNGNVPQVGAVTWVNGSTGLVGPVSPANSLVGTSANDQAGHRITALANGNYLVTSLYWKNQPSQEVGALTWCNGTTGRSGPISAVNSVVGPVGATALPDGNFVLTNPSWKNGALENAGAATWVDGTTGVVPSISSQNSLVGDQADARVGASVTVLANGNFVVGSTWHDATAAGAYTLVQAASGTSGVVSRANSLVVDLLGSSIVPLTNGNYLVANWGWSGGGIPGAGMVTWVDGTVGLVAAASPANSLIGTHPQDHVGNPVIPLANGNYAVCSPLWNDGTSTHVGAVTWGDGHSGVVGSVSASNSLVGVTNDDELCSKAVALKNGNYAVTSRNAGTGLVTWANGSVATTGAVTGFESANGYSGSLIAVGSHNYVSRNGAWEEGANQSVGAVTWFNGNGASGGTMDAHNSLVGSSAYDMLGSGGVFSMSDGYYVIVSPHWDDGTIYDAGAITLLSGEFRSKGRVAAWNSVRGQTLDGGDGMVFDYDPARHRLFVGRPYDGVVSIFEPDQVYADSFD